MVQEAMNDRRFFPREEMLSLTSLDECQTSQSIPDYNPLDYRLESIFTGSIPVIQSCPAEKEAGISMPNGLPMLVFEDDDDDEDEDMDDDGFDDMEEFEDEFDDDDFDDDDEDYEDEEDDFDYEEDGDYDEFDE